MIALKHVRLHKAVGQIAGLKNAIPKTFKRHSVSTGRITERRNDHTLSGISLLFLLLLLLLFPKPFVGYQINLRCGLYKDVIRVKNQPHVAAFTRVSYG